MRISSGTRRDQVHQRLFIWHGTFAHTRTNKVDRSWLRAAVTFQPIYVAEPHSTAYNVVPEGSSVLRALSHRLHNLGSRPSASVLFIFASFLNHNSKLEKLPEYLRDTVDWLMGKARRKEKADVAGVTGGSGAGLGGGGGLSGLAASVSLPGCGMTGGGGGNGNNGHPALGAGQLMMGQAGGAHGPYGDAEQKLYLESTVLERKIPEADLRQLVDLPPGLDLNEWLASHTIAFFEHVNLLYGAVSEYCTPTTCPDMLGPGQRQYHWIDERGKKIRLSAPQYIDYVMTYAQRTVNDESIFPTKFAHEFPATYEQILRKIQRLLFHVVAHLYHRHFRELLLLGLHGHLHALFAHLILFNRRFHLIDDKETEILNDLVIALRLQPCDEKSPSSTMPTATPRSGQPSPTPLQVTNDSNSGTDASTGVHENRGPGNAHSCEQHVRSGSGPDQCHVGASSSAADAADSR